jgi:hypothetical protein
MPSEATLIRPLPGEVDSTCLVHHSGFNNFIGYNLELITILMIFGIAKIGFLYMK